MCFSFPPYFYRDAFMHHTMHVLDAPISAMAGVVEVIKGWFFVWKTGYFLDFAKVGPVEWRSEIARAGFEFQSAPAPDSLTLKTITSNRNSFNARADSVRIDPGESAIIAPIKVRSMQNCRWKYGQMGNKYHHHLFHSIERRELSPLDPR